ncbi:hypothetical protein FQA47_005542 [Oryzias melastigma]|uniref:Uncharacterized protein n=1 Tax=Oryzias melastigma TaxID=30732 RepID=A0A834F794_ORYME|nr:hypothetical protein FQA47_005542 [Oryzias melastigma]
MISYVTFSELSRVFRCLAEESDAEEEGGGRGGGGEEEEERGRRTNSGLAVRKLCSPDVERRRPRAAPPDPTRPTLDFVFEFPLDQTDDRLRGHDLSSYLVSFQQTEAGAAGAVLTDPGGLFALFLLVRGPHDLQLDLIQTKRLTSPSEQIPVQFLSDQQVF